MPSTCCSVPDCHERGGHQYPCDPVRRAKWIQAVRRLDEKTMKVWTPTKSSVVCKKHFTSDDYVKETIFGLKPDYGRLVGTAVPSIFPWTSTKTERKIIRKDRVQARASKKGEQGMMCTEELERSFTEQVDCREELERSFTEQVTSHTKVCSAHIRPADFMRAQTGTRCLTKEAYPSVIYHTVKRRARKDPTSKMKPAKRKKLDLRQSTCSLNPPSNSNATNIPQNNDNTNTTCMDESAKVLTDRHKPTLDEKCSSEVQVMNRQSTCSLNPPSNSNATNIPQNNDNTNTTCIDESAKVLTDRHKPTLDEDIDNTNTTCMEESVKVLTDRHKPTLDEESAPKPTNHQPCVNTVQNVDSPHSKILTHSGKHYPVKLVWVCRSSEPEKILQSSELEKVIQNVFSKPSTDKDKAGVPHSGQNCVPVKYENQSADVPAITIIRKNTKNFPNIIRKNTKYLPNIIRKNTKYLPNIIRKNTKHLPTDSATAFMSDNERHIAAERHPIQGTEITDKCQRSRTITSPKPICDNENKPIKLLKRPESSTESSQILSVARQLYFEIDHNYALKAVKREPVSDEEDNISESVIKGVVSKCDTPATNSLSVASVKIERMGAKEDVFLETLREDNLAELKTVSDSLNPVAFVKMEPESEEDDVSFRPCTGTCVVGKQEIDVDVNKNCHLFDNPNSEYAGIMKEITVCQNSFIINQGDSVVVKQETDCDVESQFTNGDVEGNCPASECLNSEDVDTMNKHTMCQENLVLNSGARLGVKQETDCDAESQFTDGDVEGNCPVSECLNSQDVVTMNKHTMCQTNLVLNSGASVVVKQETGCDVIGQKTDGDVAGHSLVTEEGLKYKITVNY